MSGDGLEYLWLADDRAEALVLSLKEETANLKRQLSLYKPQGIKYSKCCDAQLMPYISLNKKMCTGCLEWFEWSLDEGQESLLTDSADKSDFISKQRGG